MVEDNTTANEVETVYNTEEGSNETPTEEVKEPETEEQQESPPIEEKEFEGPQVTGCSWDPRTDVLTVTLASPNGDTIKWERTTHEEEYNKFAKLFVERDGEEPGTWKQRVNEYFFNEFSRSNK